MITPTVFISYSHKDENYRRALEQRLNVLKAAGRIDTWDDRKVPPGAKWEKKIKKNLDKSQLILFLVSIDFLDSGFVQKVEIPTALKRQDEEGTVLVPIIVRSVDWSNVKQLNSLQALPILRGAEEEVVPVDDWPSKDRAWTEVEKGLRRAIDELLKNETVSSSQPSPAETSSPRTLSPQLPSPRRVGEGLLALTRILKAPDATAIAQQTGETLARARVEARQRIEELGTDKDLHQQLLDLQFKCYNSASQQSRRNANEVDWEVLDNIGLAFARIVSDLGRIQSGSLLRPADIEWIAELGSAALTFRQSLKDRAIDPLRETARVLSQIISIKPSEINGRLRDADGGLLLQPLSDALAAVKAELRENELSTQDGQTFLSGMETLADLRTYSTQLIEEHDLWQRIDVEMRRIGAQLRYDTSDLEFAWTGAYGLQGKLLARVDADPNADWSKELRNAINTMQIALGTNDQDLIVQAFRRLHSLAGNRFYAVGRDLKQLFDAFRIPDNSL